MTQAEQKDPVFRLKGNLLAVTLLEVTANDLDSLQEQLAAKVASAPSFFNDTPLIIGLERLGDEDGDVDLPRLLEICRSFRLLPLAVRALRESDRAAAVEAGLALLSPPGHVAQHSDSTPEPASSDVPLLDESNQLDAAPDDSESAAAEEADADDTEPSEAEAEAEAEASDEEVSPLEPEEPPVINPTRVVSQPVRGGQQIYARGGDLVVLSAVSPGAELIADGNIHIYGPMRGRAMAGASGNTEARIFIHQLTAELVSIAGCYRIAEDLRRGPQWGHPVAISLAGDVLNITRL